MGTSASVGGERGFSFTLSCSREQGDGWDGNGLEVVLKLVGVGATGPKQLIFMPAYPSNDANRQMGLAPQRTRLTQTDEFQLVGDEADAQGEVNYTVDADAATCAINDSVVKVR